MYIFYIADIINYVDLLIFCFFFFFSSRRRHTRYWRDWSSDVCSSDLAVPVRHRVLLDPAALLGAVAAHEGRVRARRRADAAGRARRVRDAPPDRPLQRAALRRDPAAVLGRRLRRHLPRGLARAQRAVHRRRRASPAPRRPPQRAAPVPLLARVPRAAVRRDGARRAPLGLPSQARIP